MIAAFMGLKQITKIDSDTLRYYNAKKDDWQDVPMYDNWQELMPVIDRIEAFDGDTYSFEIWRSGCVVWIGDDSSEEFWEDNKLASTYCGVVWLLQKLKADGKI